MKRVIKSDDVRSKYVSIIIPVYNEEENIPLLHERIQQVMEKQQFSYEIIYVDDGSKDATFVQLKRIVMLDEHVQVERLDRQSLKRILTNGPKAVLLHVAQEAVFKVSLAKAASVVVAQEPLKLGRR